MYFGIFNRMILAELVKVFLMSLIALTGMFLLAGMIQEATQKGLSPGQILTIIPLIIPNTLPFTIPATTLFATCVVYGRMSADNEVLVLRAVGVNIYHLLWPALILGLGTTAATAAMFYDPIPRSQSMLRNQLLKDGEDIIYGMIKREGGLRQSSLEFVLYVRDVQGRDLIDVVVKKRTKERRGYEFVARSQTATIWIRKVTDTPSEASTVSSENEGRPEDVMDRFKKRRAGTRGAERYELVIRMVHCFVDSMKGETAAEIQMQEYTTPLPEAIFGKDPLLRPSAQTWKELRVNRDILRQEVVDMEAYIEAVEAKGVTPTGVPGKSHADLARELRLGPLKDDEHLLRQHEIEMQTRPALAVGCLCFVLIGCPVGIWASRSDYLSVFMICFLPTVFVYYPMLLATVNLAKDGKVPPTAVWIADGVAAIASLVLIQRLMKR
ncbi:MAG TPA: LptF/LptG family permease [Gemmataceae bacterium]|nr:LptF/LptG family permease [Gemmataceae bacterium]